MPEDLRTQLDEILSYLAAAGVGTLTIIDDDVVSLSNLQRQILHTENDVGRSKAESAKETINGINPNVEEWRVRARVSRESYHQAISAIRGRPAYRQVELGGQPRPYHDAFLEPIAVPVVANW